MIPDVTPSPGGGLNNRKMEGSIVEDSYYDHAEYGRVRVVDVTNGVVSMEKQNETVPITGGRIPAGVKQSAAGFREDAEPADVTVNADAIVINTEALENDASSM